MATLGQRMKQRRKKLNKSQQQIADLLHISQGTYNGYENDKHKPDIETLSKIADIMETSMDYLMGRYKE